MLGTLLGVVPSLSSKWLPWGALRLGFPHKLAPPAGKRRLGSGLCLAASQRGKWRRHGKQLLS